MRGQRVLKIEEREWVKEDKPLDEQIMNLIGEDVSKYFKEDFTETIVFIQSVSVVSFRNRLQAYVVANTRVDENENRPRN